MSDMRCQRIICCQEQNSLGRGQKSLLINNREKEIQKMLLGGYAYEGLRLSILLLFLFALRLCSTSAMPVSTSIMLAVLQTEGMIRQLNEAGNEE